MTILNYVYAYLIGGITFIPLLIIGFIYLHPKIDESENSEAKDEGISAGAIEEGLQSGLLTYKAGWVIVTQDYIESYDDIDHTTLSINESQSAYSTLYKLAQSEKDANTEATALPPPASPTHTNPTSNTNSSNIKRHRFYAVLKHGNLFLYKNEDMKDVKNVIVLSNQFVTMYPRNVADGQLFTKRTAVCLIKKDWSRSRRLSERDDTLDDKLTLHDIIDENLPLPKSSFFIYADTNIDKEDWYFSLINGSKVKYDYGDYSAFKHARSLHFKTNEMIDLMSTLYSSEGHLQMKWFNGLLGRIFLSLKGTEALHEFLRTKITKKLQKIKTPGFLDKFKLGNLDPGYSVPFFTYPNLKEINPNGTMILSAYVHYHGEMSCNISTKLTMSIGKTSKSMDVVLKVTLSKLEGPVIFKIKPPPSDRLWYCFEIDPIMNLKIEPVISSRQMSYNIITNTIEKKFKEAIKESLVYPNFDDMVFYNSEGELFRGGIWDHGDDTEEDHNISVANAGSTKLPDPNINGSDAESVAESTTTTSIPPSLKISNTLNDLSKKIKKTKSNHTVSVNGTNFLSDGSMESNPLLKTWKKVGTWYNSKDDKMKDKVEMISNRRKPRSPSSEFEKPKESTEPSAFNPAMFTKDSFHTRSDSRFSLKSDESKAFDPRSTRASSFTEKPGSPTSPREETAHSSEEPSLSREEPSLSREEKSIDDHLNDLIKLDDIHFKELDEDYLNEKSELNFDKTSPTSSEHTKTSGKPLHRKPPPT